MPQGAMNHNHVVPLDEPLVRRAQRGDRAAFEALYRRHAGRVYALALRMSGSRARAEELTQDVFVRLGEQPGDAELQRWLSDTESLKPRVLVSALHLPEGS